MKSLGLADVTARATLEAIDLVDFEIHRKAPSNGTPLEYPATLEVKLDVQMRSPKQPPINGASFFAVCTATWADSAKPEETLARVTTTFRVTYTFQGLEEPMSAELSNQFGAQLALHHVWPFLRERTTAGCAALMLPQFVLPLRQPPQLAAAGKATAKGTTKHSASG